MRRNPYMRRELLALVIFTCARLTMADSAPNNFRECMNTDGPRYLQAVSNLFQQTDAKTFLESVASSRTAPQAERRLADILLARMERPSLFDEFSKRVVDARRGPDYGRGSYFEGCLLQFTSTGPESKFVWEIDEGGEKKVEKYTDADVRTGKARNAAARLALVEYFLKFSQDFNDYYEMPEMLSALKVLEDGRGWLGRTKRPEFGIPTQDLIEAVCKEEKRPLPVRVAAVSLLPEDKFDKTAVAGLMVKALQDEELQDDRKYRRTAETAAEFLRLYGDRQSLSALKANAPKTQWKRELVEKTLKEITARTGQDPQNTLP